MSVRSGGRRRRDSSGAGVVSLSSKPGRPSERVAIARIATAPPSVATRPAVRMSSSSVGVPPRLVRTRSAPVEQEHQADADAQDVSAVEDRQDRQRRQREPGGGGERRARSRSAQAVAGVADDRRGGRQECLGRPADERAARCARRDRAWRPTGGSRRGPQPPGARPVPMARQGDRPGAARRPSSPPGRGSPCVHSGRTRPRRLRR